MYKRQTVHPAWHDRCSHQICENVFDNNDQKDIYAYEGADEPEVYPFTGVNVDNVFE